jgi:thiol-disulfide isomerase/thioredoxin
MSHDTETSTETSQTTSQSFLNSSNFYVLLFGGIMLVGLLALAWIGRPPQSALVGQKLPRLDLQPLLNVEQPITNQELAGNLSVIHFWGTWCPPCQLEFPEFVELAKEFNDEPNVQIISVSCSSGPELDLQDLKSKTADFLADYTTNIPTYSDAAGMTRQQLAMLSTVGSFGYPTTLLVDREGIIVEAIAGYRPGEMENLIAEIKSML